jgi:hypothetical protein
MREQDRMKDFNIWDKDSAKEREENTSMYKESQKRFRSEK